ncbi:tryptophanyl-tRNA synthetase [Thiohalorhabdus denitrificans]|uniref:tryptophan--tRNA ligase n=2 Tax=Thiohalorhabdus denitrificans TaxID=381306 RepID=A0A1G5DFZ3_9GAMM|nr:tryptophanyl-tRNA synthetase [Thiohalorhabdus denitrificans]
MRPTGRLHLGHYHGVLKNWLQLQRDNDCFFFVADWHALTTTYEDPRGIPEATREMLVDWLAVGIDPEQAVLFVQSAVKQHAELHLLLSMITPLPWLERVPTFRDQQEQLADRNLATYGFLGYPLLQSADILIYKADGVPVGEDQLSHLDLTRQVARHFNWLYGREADHDEKVEAAIKKMAKKAAGQFRKLRAAWRESGDAEALEQGKALLAEQQNLGRDDRERLLGELEGRGREILPEPAALLTPDAKFPGLDGRKMSKSYGNTIGLREAPEQVTEKIRTMPTDPARVRRTDPGTPEKCPVWELHQVYSDAETKAWAHEGCTTAGIGCIDCKGPVIEAVLAEQAPIRERAEQLASDPDRVWELVAEGNRQAAGIAEETLTEVRGVLGLGR